MITMRYTNIFPNPVDKGFLRFSIDTNPEKHRGYSEHIDFDPETHLQWIRGKWELKDGEIIIRFVHIKGGRTKTVVIYQENRKFTFKIDDTDSDEGDYHIELNGKRVEEHIHQSDSLHPLLFCLSVLLNKLVKIKGKEIPIYFFFEKRVKSNPEIVDTILKHKPQNANLFWYCYAISYKLWEDKRTKDLRLTKEWMNELRTAIEWVNEHAQKDGFIKIPWGVEQKIFPIPISAVSGDVILLDSYGNENPKLPDFLSSIPFRKKVPVDSSAWTDRK